MMAPVNVIKNIELLANHSRLTPAKICRVTGLGVYSVDRLLLTARLIPWVKVDKNADGYKLSIDYELRCICEGIRPRPSLPDGVSLAAFLSDLRLEITSRRKANKDERAKARWNPEAIVTRFQTELLDWIEGRLDLVNALLNDDRATAPNGREARDHSHSEHGENNVQKSERGRIAVNTGTSG